VKTVRRVSLFVVFAGLFAVAGLGDAPAQPAKGKPPAKAADPAAATMSFHIYKDRGGKFRWRLMDAAGTEVGMANKGYDAKADCQKVIDSIIAGAAKAKVEDESK